MTAQGEDILAYLDAAISIREERARALGGGEIKVKSYGSGLISLEGAIHLADGGALHEDEVAWIVLNDPESALRRCAADRKLIAEHGPCSDQDLGCKGCGFNNQEESMVDHYEDCPVLCALAEGYGWTEGER